jgi:nicotinamide-nucleotide amidase
MNVALLTIGNELLSGFTVDTNAAWIGQELVKLGVPITEHLTIGDDRDRILSALVELEQRVDVIIATGGLGPTHDDVTPTAFYTFFKSKPEFDESYWEELKERFSGIRYQIPEINRNQAMRPHNGEVIPNPVGSARGLHYEREGRHYFALPGVPQEMRAMMNGTVLPWFRKQSQKELFVKTLRTTGIPESALAEKLTDILAEKSSCSVAFLPQLIGVDLRLSSRDRETLATMEERITSRIRKYLFGYDDQTLEAAVGQMLTERKLTLAIAESCTGGLLGHRLTNVSGSSRYLMGGVVAYSNEAKIRFLGVQPDVLEREGAVSEATAAAMATGVRDRFQTDLGVSITGIAGPTGGTPEKPVGLVYIALADKRQVRVKRLQFARDRGGNKLLSSQAALNLIRLTLQEAVEN